MYPITGRSSSCTWSIISLDTAQVDPWSPAGTIGTESSDVPGNSFQSVAFLILFEAWLCCIGKNKPSSSGASGRIRTIVSQSLYSAGLLQSNRSVRQRLATINRFQIKPTWRRHLTRKIAVPRAKLSVDSCTSARARRSALRERGRLDIRLHRRRFRPIGLFRLSYSS